jgi:hypothetical protein
MRSESAATIQPPLSASSTYQIVRRPSATFLVLDRVTGEGPEPGTLTAEIEIGGVQAPCGITVLDEGPGGEVWCRPRGPLPPLAVGDETILRFSTSRPEDRR